MSVLFGVVVVLHTVLLAKIIHLFGELARFFPEHAQTLALRRLVTLGLPACYRQVLSACQQIGSRDARLLATLLRIDMAMLGGTCVLAIVVALLRSF